WGRFLYVDDLSTLPEARRRGYGREVLEWPGGGARRAPGGRGAPPLRGHAPGYGRQLLEWLGEEAERLGCEQFHLDSGVGPTRTDAHRLYLNTGLEITSFHFARGLDAQPAAARSASP